MEKNRMKKAVVMWVVLMGFLAQNMVIPVMGRNLEEARDQKWNTPKNSHKSAECKTPPASGGGGSSSGGGGGRSKSGGGSSSGGGGRSRGGVGGSSGGGGTYSPTPLTPPSPTLDPVTPSTPPRNPFFDPVPPSTTPTTPTYNPTPTVPDPSIQPSYPGTCIFWGKHPKLIWGLFGFWGTVGGIFGPVCTSAFGGNLSLQQALLNTRNDGIGSLYREGTASLLNSMVTTNFPYTTQEVKDHFVAALVSDQAAAAQAQLFKKANEGHLKL